MIESISHHLKINIPTARCQYKVRREGSPMKEVIHVDITKDRVVPDSQPPVNADHSPPPNNDLGRFLRTDESK